jgi:hypothetical protein
MLLKSEIDAEIFLKVELLTANKLPLFHKENGEDGISPNTMKITGQLS